MMSPMCMYSWRLVCVNGSYKVILSRLKRSAMPPPQTLKKSENDISNFLLLLPGKFILFVGRDLRRAVCQAPWIGRGSWQYFIAIKGILVFCEKGGALLTNNLHVGWDFLLSKEITRTHGALSQYYSSRIL